MAGGIEKKSLKLSTCIRYQVCNSNSTSTFIDVKSMNIFGISSKRTHNRASSNIYGYAFLGI